MSQLARYELRQTVKIRNINAIVVVIDYAPMTDLIVT